MPWAEVWLRGEQPPLVSRQAGALTIGRVFHAREMNAGIEGGAPPALSDLCRSRWGAYVAMVQEGAETWVLRDPSGAGDAVAWRASGTVVISSSLDQLPPALAPDVSVDWDVVTDFVRRALSAAGRTALTGVVSPVAGEAVEVASGRRVQLWRPADAARAPAPREPARALAASLDDVCATWTGAYGALMAEVSGGFDSALVAVTARRSAAGGRIGADLNYYGDRREGDERRWAACAAAAADLPLLAHAKPVRALTEADFAETANGVRPSFTALDPVRDRHTAGELNRHKADALLTGYGGDAVFFQMPSALPAADYLAEPGWRTIFDPFFLGTSRWLRRSVWSVLSEARRARLETDRVSYFAPFLGPRAREAGQGLSHPWLEGIGTLPPGKQLQVLHVVVSQLTFGRSRRGEAADLLYPLLSQPLVETALAIPSWKHLDGGRDRALARSVAADRLPPEIVARRSKGMLTSYYARQVCESLGFLRAYLLDGRLAAEGVLDRAAMDAALHPDRLIWRGDGIGLLSAAALEAWVRRWSA
ncbi:asparagine synthase-related protein [Phenylobacterium zucineum]|nr:asparagine synthase-related protein [Phenylobacterium zucineum]